MGVIVEPQESRVVTEVIAVRTVLQIDHHSITGGRLLQLWELLVLSILTLVSYNRFCAGPQIVIWTLTNGDDVLLRTRGLES